MISPDRISNFQPEVKEIIPQGGRFFWVLPGQGESRVGNGLDIYLKFPQVQSMYRQATRIIGRDVARICFEGSGDELNNTENAQPINYLQTVASVTAFRLLHPEVPNPDVILGHSQGEYAAAHLAGVLGFEDGLEISAARGRFAQQLQAKSPGGMAAVLGLPKEQMIRICSMVKGISLANLNYPRQGVISGLVEALNNGMELAKKEGGKVIPLRVTGAFHSEWAIPVRDQLAQFIADKKIVFHDASIPILLNHTNQLETSGQNVLNGLLNNLTGPIDMEELVKTLNFLQIQTGLEFGSEKLIGFVKKINSQFKGASMPNLASILSPIIK